MGQAGTRRVLFQDLPSSGRKRKRLLEVGARGGITQSHRRAGQTVRPRKESRASHGGKRVVRDPEMGREPGFRGGDTAAPDRSHFAVCVVGGGTSLHAEPETEGPGEEKNVRQVGPGLARTRGSARPRLTR